MQGNFQQQANSSKYNFENYKAPPTGYKGPGQFGQGAAQKQSSQARKMTAISSNQGKNFKSKQGDTFYMLDKKQPENKQEETFKKTEKQITALAEESATLKVKGDLQTALEKAKEAYTKEKSLKREREKAGMVDSINVDLSYYVTFNLANMLQACGSFEEAKSKYNELIKNPKQFPQAGRLRVNLGNISFQQGKYEDALKMYQMAHDLVPASSKEMRMKIMKNIAHTYVKCGEFKEAINRYERVVNGAPDFITAFNLMVCLFTLGDKQGMEGCFVQMLAIEIPGFTEEEEEEMANDKINVDNLREEIKEKKRQAIKIIVDSAKLIAPFIQGDTIKGYEWILEQVKKSYFPEVESEIEICRAMAYLKNKNMEQAIEILKSFEKKDKQIMARVSTNVSFLYFLEQDFNQAEKYAEIAIEYDRYNAKALVNRGNCLYIKNEFLRAKEQYLEAIGVEADCIEALYNLAFVNKKLNMFMEALQALEKLQTIISTPEVLYQMANIHELTGNTKLALKWYQVLLTQVKTDPQILIRVGGIFARDGDEQQALHYYQESYKYLNTNIDTISWLGIYYVKQELYEKACSYFERASQIQQKEIKWRLMVASCYRRMGSYQKAKKLYEDIYQEDPNNLECLKFLVQLCKDMNQPYEEYVKAIRQIEDDQQMGMGGFGQEQTEIQPQANPQYSGPIEDDNVGNIQAPNRNNRRQENDKPVQKKPQQQDEDMFGDDDVPL